MPENKILDPFKPAQPRIPGVSTPDEMSLENARLEDDPETPEYIGPPPPAQREAASPLRVLWIGLTLTGALTALLLFGLKHNSAPAESASVAEPAKLDVLISEAPPMDAKLPTAPGVVATTAQLSKTWSARRFYFRDPVTLKPAPAMVVRLPGGTLWGFSLLEPFGSCELEYVTDLRKLRTSYGFDAAYPMVVDPCNGSVFDLTAYGGAPSGLVRGEVEKGPGWRPPTAIEIRTDGNQVIASRMER